MLGELLAFWILFIRCSDYKIRVHAFNVCRRAHCWCISAQQACRTASTQSINHCHIWVDVSISLSLSELCYVDCSCVWFALMEHLIKIAYVSSRILNVQRKGSSNRWNKMNGQLLSQKAQGATASHQHFYLQHDCDTIPNTWTHLNTDAKSSHHQARVVWNDTSTNLSTSSNLVIYPKSKQIHFFPCYHLNKHLWKCRSLYSSTLLLILKPSAPFFSSTELYATLPC